MDIEQKERRAYAPSYQYIGCKRHAGGHGPDEGSRKSFSLFYLLGFRYFRLGGFFLRCRWLYTGELVREGYDIFAYPPVYPAAHIVVRISDQALYPGIYHVRLILVFLEAGP